MKKLVIAFALLVVSFGTAQAQYQDLIDAKMSQLVQLQKQVVVSTLPEAEKDAALDTLAENVELLTNHRDEVDIAKLQTLETEINQINGQLAAKILEAKKTKLTQKLNQLADVITTRQAAGQDATALESLWQEMNTALQNL